MPLDDLTIRNAKPAAKASKLFDERGLFLLVTPSGSKLWRLKYRFAGKEKSLTLGSYPEVSLKNARLRRDDARAMVRDGRDPSAERKAAKQKQAREARNAFKAVALEFIGKMLLHRSEKHRAEALSRLQNNIFPELANRPIDKIEPPELLAVLRKIESRGAHEMTHRVRALCGQVFRYGISCGVCTRDPAADLRGALVPVKQSHMPVIPLEELPQLLIAIDNCEEAPACRDRQTRLALQLLALTFVRSSELRKGLWSQVNLNERTWTPAVEVMKTRRPHIVPLSRQAIVALEELHEFTGHSRFMFPGEGKKGVMSENTALYGLYSLGYRDRMCGHGFRSLSSTILNEAGCFDEDWIELQLSHQERNKIRRAYNHAKWLDQRFSMMQWYADYLDKLREGHFIKPIAFANTQKPALPLAA
ncbi:MAG: integrase arm-type DNA-binding domain-containing protein [Rhodomicrobium sp.]